MGTRLVDVRFAAVALGAALTLVSAGALAQEAAPAAGDEAAKAQALAKKLSNPIANLVIVPIQMNFDYGQGADGSGYKFVTNIQPVIPVSLNQDWNVLSRTILPLAYQSHVVGDGSQGARRHDAELLLLAEGTDQGRHHLGRRAGDPAPDRD